MRARGRQAARCHARMVDRAPRGTSHSAGRGLVITGMRWSESAQSRQPPRAFTSHRLMTSVTPDTDKLVRQLSLVAYLMAERRSASARDVKQAVEGYSEMSDEAFARRFYADRSELLALGVPLQSQRDDFTGEELLHAPAGALLPAGPRPQRRRTGGALDRGAPVGWAVRLCRAPAAGPPEPRARPPQPVVRRRTRGVRAAARERLHGRGRAEAAEARDRHLEAAHSRLPLLGDLLQRGGDTDGRSLQPLPHEWSLVRDRARSRPRRRAHLQARPRARRRALRDPPQPTSACRGVDPERLPQPNRPNGSWAMATSRRRSWSSPTPPGSSTAPSASTGRSSTATTARCRTRPRWPTGRSWPAG